MHWDNRIYRELELSIIYNIIRLTQALKLYQRKQIDNNIYIYMYRKSITALNELGKVIANLVDYCMMLSVVDWLCV